MEEFSEGEFRGKVLEKLDNIEKKVDTKVDRIEFAPVKSIVYGLVGLIMMAVIGGLVSLVVKAFENLTY